MEKKDYSVVQRSKGSFSGCQGTLKSNDMWYWNMQTHPGWEIVLVVEGTGHMQVEDQQFQYEPGVIICIPPNARHVSVPDLYLKDFCLGIMESPIQGEQACSFRDDEHQSFLKLMQMYHQVNMEEPANYENILISLFYTMRHFLLSWHERAPGREMLLLAALIRSNLSNCSFKIADAIEKIPLSASAVRKQFRQAYGQSPLGYLNDLRIDRGKQLLLGSDHTVSEIALQCGFDDPKYFTRSFRQATGFSPAEYRKKAEIMQKKV